MGKTLEHLLLHLIKISNLYEPSSNSHKAYLSVLGASIDDILESLIGIDSKSLCNFRNSFWTKCTFSICIMMLADICYQSQICQFLAYVCHLTLCPAHILGELSNNRQRMCQLSLATSRKLLAKPNSKSLGQLTEFSIYLTDAHSLKATAQKSA